MHSFCSGMCLNSCKYHLVSACQCKFRAHWVGLYHCAPGPDSCMGMRPGPCQGPGLGGVGAGAYHTEESGPWPWPSTARTRISGLNRDLCQSLAMFVCSIINVRRRSYPEQPTSTRATRTTYDRLIPHRWSLQANAESHAPPQAALFAHVQHACEGHGHAEGMPVRPGMPLCLFPRRKIR
jgi:hypothetical protein